MTGAIAHEEAATLRAVLSGPLHTPSGQSVDLPEKVRKAILNALEALEESDTIVVFPVDAMLSTQQVADVLGVSRMTVTRIIDRGEMYSSGAGVHRRVTAAELTRYRKRRRRDRADAVRTLADDIHHDLPPDQEVKTR